MQTGQRKTQPCFTPLRIGKAPEVSPSQQTQPGMLSWNGFMMVKSFGGQPGFFNKVEGLGEIDKGEIQGSPLLPAFLLQLSKGEDHVHCGSCYPEAAL